eukprot:2682012-Pleurochrysis_carterae.AAC.1
MPGSARVRACARARVSTRARARVSTRARGYVRGEGRQQGRTGARASSRKARAIGWAGGRWRERTAEGICAHWNVRDVWRRRRYRCRRYICHNMSQLHASACSQLHAPRITFPFQHLCRLEVLSASCQARFCERRLVSVESPE